jgi:hypothetical protein
VTTSIRHIAKNDKVDAYHQVFEGVGVLLGADGLAVEDHAHSLYYVDHAIASLNGNQAQAGERVSYTDT